MSVATDILRSNHFSTTLLLSMTSEPLSEFSHSSSASESNEMMTSQSIQQTLNIKQNGDWDLRATIIEKHWLLLAGCNAVPTHLFVLPPNSLIVYSLTFFAVIGRELEFSHPRASAYSSSLSGILPTSSIFLSRAISWRHRVWDRFAVLWMEPVQLSCLQYQNHHKQFSFLTATCQCFSLIKINIRLFTWRNIPLVYVMFYWNRNTTDISYTKTSYNL